MNLSFPPLSRAAFSMFPRWSEKTAEEVSGSQPTRTSRMKYNLDFHLYSRFSWRVPEQRPFRRRTDFVIIRRSSRKPAIDKCRLPRFDDETV
jgi:hypothetical protein